MGRRRFLVVAGAATLGVVGGCGTGSGGSPGSGSTRFIDDFQRPPGPIGNGWTDAHTAVPRYQDQLRLVRGGVADVALQGPRDIDPDYSGWRGAFYRDLPSSPAGMSVNARVYLHRGQVSSGGGPLAHCAPASSSWALGAWYDLGGYLNWYEFGLVGRTPADYRWLDTCFAPHPPFERTFDLEIRSSHGSAAVFADGKRVCGPVAIPTELVSATRHGGQIDVGSRAEQSVPQITRIAIDRYDGGPIPDYQAAQVVAAAPVSQRGTTSLSLPIPTDAATGDLLIAVLGLASTHKPAPPPGWATAGAGVSPPGLGLACYTRYVSGGEGPSATWGSIGEAGAAGVIVRARGVNPHVGLLGLPDSMQVVPASSSVPTPSCGVIGLHRLGLWAGVAGAGSTLGTPAGWTHLVPSQPDAAVALTLAVMADWGKGPASVLPPYEQRGTPTPVSMARLEPAGPSLAFQALVQPQPTPLA